MFVEKNVDVAAAACTDRPSHCSHSMTFFENEPCATPIKSIFSLLKAGKLKASLKKAEADSKLQASQKQATSKLKAS